MQGLESGLNLVILHLHVVVEDLEVDRELAGIGVRDDSPMREETFPLRTACGFGGEGKFASPWSGSNGGCGGDRSSRSSGGMKNGGRFDDLGLHRCTARSNLAGRDLGTGRTTVLDTRSIAMTLGRSKDHSCRCKAEELRETGSIRVRTVKCGPENVETGSRGAVLIIIS